MESLTKRCSRCKRELPVEEFYRATRTKDGLNCCCKPCCSAWHKAYRKKVTSQRVSPPETKYCAGCHQTLPSDQFWKNASSTDGLQRTCKTCHSSFQSICLRRRSKQDPLHYRKLCFRRDYRMTPEQVHEMKISCGFQCAICGGVFSEDQLVVDHNHTTKVVRKPLCRPCNSGIGMALENPSILEAAIKYLGS